MMAVTPSGKDKILRYTRIYVSGYDLSGDSRTFGSAMNSITELPREGWDDAHKHFISNAQRQLGLDGYQAIFNDSAGQSFPRLKDVSNTGVLDLVFGGGGEPAIGDPAYMLRAVQMSNPVNIGGGMAVLQANFMPDASQYDDDVISPTGRLLADAATQITETINKSSVDFETSFSNGAWANLHILVTASGDYAFKIQDSANDSDWADLVSFTIDGSVVEAETVDVSGSIDQYVRFVATRTAGSVYVVCTFSPNLGG